MNFKIPRSIFLSGIRKTLGIAEKKTTQPILNNILLKVRNNSLSIMATDMEITLISRYDAEVSLEGEITVSAKKLFEMIREIPDGSVNVKKTEGNVLIISCQKALYRIKGISADDYPTIVDESPELDLYPVDRSMVLELIRKTYFAISTDETRQNLTGAFMEVETREGDSILKMAATDGHRLAVAESFLPAESKLVMEKGIIIPRKGVLEIKRLLEENIGEIFLGFERGLCVVKSSQDILKVSLIEAEFPNYRRVIPQERGITISFEKEIIFHALKRINVISSEGYGGVLVTVQDDHMYLTFNDSELGEASDEIEIEYKGDKISNNYSVAYFLAALEVIDEPSVAFEIGTESRPSVLRGSGNDRYLCIIMPLKG